MSSHLAYSVLMSVYTNETASNLKESIDSVLAQSVPPFEFVIVEDGLLNDSLRATLDQYEQRYPDLFHFVKKEKNEGLGLALRLGVEHCCCEWIARMDSDDIWHSNKMEKQIDVLEKNPDLDMIGCVYIEFFEDNTTVLRQTPQTHEELYQYLHRRNPFGHDSMLLHKQSILAAGNYQDELRFEDYGLWIRLVLNGAKMHNLQIPYLYVRANLSYYNRRGGMQYFLQNFAFFKKYYQRGFFTLKDCILSLTPRFIVALIPGNVRTYIYKKMLRKENKHEI